MLKDWLRVPPKKLDWLAERQQKDFDVIAAACRGRRVRPEQADELKAIIDIAADYSYGKQLQLPLPKG